MTELDRLLARAGELGLSAYVAHGQGYCRECGAIHAAWIVVVGNHPAAYLASSRQEAEAALARWLDLTEEVAKARLN